MVAMDSYPYTSSVVLYGMTTLDSSWGSYCDHYHLYSFYYDTVTVSDSSTDTTLDFSVWGWSMIGFPNLCTYTDGMAISYPLIESIDVATTGDQFAMTCGYYTEYDWSGEGDVYFEVNSMNAMLKTVTAVAGLAIAALFY